MKGTCQKFQNLDKININYFLKRKAILKIFGASCQKTTLNIINNVLQIPECRETHTRTLPHRSLCEYDQKLWIFYFM